MANQTPAGRWMRMATLRPMQNPAQDPPSPQPPATRPVLGRTFTTVPFRPAVPTVPAPVAAMPPAPVIAPLQLATPNLPAVRAARPSSAQPAVSANGIPPSQGAVNTTSVANGTPPSLRVYTATNGVPSPQQAPKEVPTNGVPSTQAVPNATITNGGQFLQSPPRAPAAPVPNMKPSPQPAPPSPVNINDIPSPPKAFVAPTVSSAQQTSPMIAGNGTQRLPSPRVNSPPALPTGIGSITSSPSSKTQYNRTSYSPSQKSPQQTSVLNSYPADSPSPRKQAASSPNFTSTTTSAPLPQTVTFSNVQTFTSPTKPQASPTASTPQIPSPQSPKPLSLAPPPSPLQLPPPQLPSEIPQEPEQKSILFQHTSQNHNKHSTIPNHKTPQIANHSINNTTPITKPKHPQSSNTNGSIITMAGENRGALMNLTRPNHTTNPHQKFPGNPHKQTTSSPNGTESDQSSNGKPKSKDSVSSAMRSLMNSNVQGINNSIMFNSRVTHHDPGVHVALSRKHKGRGSGGGGGGGGGGSYTEHSDGHQS